MVKGTGILKVTNVIQVRPVPKNCLVMEVKSLSSPLTVPFPGTFDDGNVVVGGYYAWPMNCLVLLGSVKKSK